MIFGTAIGPRSFVVEDQGPNGTGKALKISDAASVRNVKV